MLGALVAIFFLAVLLASIMMVVIEIQADDTFDSSRF